MYKISKTIQADVVKRMGSIITGKVLDVGCGPYDRYSRYFNNTSLVKFDLVDSDNADVVGDATNLPFEDNEFDCIYSNDTLEHIEDTNGVISEMSRVIKSNGYALISVPFMYPVHANPYDFWRFSATGLPIKFKEYGFELIDVEQIGGFFSTVSHYTQRYILHRFKITNRFLLAIITRIYQVWGKFVIWLDSKDNHHDNRKFTLGNVFIFKKL